MIGKTMLFNPFTGAPRHPDDIKSDPQGLLVWDGETPLAAAAPVQTSAAEVAAREALKPGAWLSVRPHWLTSTPEFRVHARPTDGARPVVLLDEAVAYIASLPAAEQSSREQERRKALVQIGQAAVAAGWRDGYLEDFVRDRLLTGAMAADPVHGDVLPPIGTDVLIRHGRDDDDHECTVIGYYVWPDLRGDPSLQRVFVRLVYKGTLNQQARMLRDLRRMDGTPFVSGERVKESDAQKAVHAALGRALDALQAVADGEGGRIVRVDGVSTTRLDSAQWDEWRKLVADGVLTAMGIVGWALGGSKGVSPSPAHLAWNALTEQRLDAFLDDYEMRGEDSAGRDACHTPTEGERALIKDAIMGLLAEVDEEARAAAAKAEGGAA